MPPLKRDDSADTDRSERRHTTTDPVAHNQTAETQRSPRIRRALHLKAGDTCVCAVRLACQRQRFENNDFLKRGGHGVHASQRTRSHHILGGGSRGVDDPPVPEYEAKSSAKPSNDWALWSRALSVDPSHFPSAGPTQSCDVSAMTLRVSPCPPCFNRDALRLRVSIVRRFLIAIETPRAPLGFPSGP